MNVKSNADTTLVMKREYAAPVAKVYEALSRPGQMQRWMAPAPEMTCTVTADVRVGGRYRVHMRSPEGKDHIAIGVYEEIVPGRKLVMTWAWENEPERDVPSRLTLELAESGSGTALTLTHDRFADSEERDHHSMGWTGCLARLDERFAAAKK
jgi:uncharacterized protein YndB with AHSA1/START domain